MNHLEMYSWSDNIMCFCDQVFGGNKSSNGHYFFGASKESIVLLDLINQEPLFLKNISYNCVQGFNNVFPSNDGHCFYSFENKAHNIVCYQLIDKNGKINFEKELGARNNLICFSEDSRYVCFQTLNSYKDNSGYNLYIIDIQSGSLINKFQPEGGISDFCFIDSKNKILTLSNRDGFSLDYSFKGELLDRSKWQLFKEERDLKRTWEDPYRSLEFGLKLIENVPENSSINDYGESFKYIKHAIYGVSEHHKSIAYRKMGEIYLGLHYKDKALKLFNKALSFDEKIGIKKLAHKLKAELEKS